ncbi:hypothetical protein LCGC14_0645410 [marine sediment metagenome]|uniref:Uncharacterized protein n=1 Tax=marine sediment metagenome TaxID=412755 RepID=A0A0F9QXY9_9ZZZZ
MRDLTVHEQHVLLLLAFVWNEFLSLPSAHVMEKQEFMDAIHRAQHIIMARPAVSAMNDKSLLKIVKD